MIPLTFSKDLRDRLSQVQILLCDVDGVLTDSTLWIGNGGETKRFCVQDGLGIRLMRESGFKVGWISGRVSPATEQRAKELHIDFLHQGSDNKTLAGSEILQKTGLGWENVCYIGDDLVDLGMLRRAGLAVTVPHGMAEAKELAHYITETPGGHGAVREVIELILKAHGKWETIIEKEME